MTTTPLLFCFDYIDPLSYLLEMELRALSDEGGLAPIRRLPLELCPPPTPLVDPDDARWRSRWAQAEEAAAALRYRLVEPPLLPWTRKAHELVLHADVSGVGDAVHRGLFRAVFEDGLDVGRIDVLVDVARGLGLDATQTKAVLDVDRHSDAVALLGDEATAAGAETTPTLVLDAKILRGFHNRDALRTFLLR